MVQTKILKEESHLFLDDFVRNRKGNRLRIFQGIKRDDIDTLYLLGSSGNRKHEFHTQMVLNRISLLLLSFPEKGSYLKT